MPEYVFHYFDVWGRGEVPRMLFHLADVPFTDRRFGYGEWSELKEKKDLFVFGQSPVLEVDGKPLAQSITIMRYLANKFGFAGNSDFERAQVDSIADRMQDFLNETMTFYCICAGYIEGNKEELYEKELVPARDKLYTQLTQFIKENPTKSGFLIAAHKKLVSELPKMAEYLEKRKYSIV